MPDVTHCSTLYHHLFGTENILKYFLINHVPAIGFASRLCLLIPDSRHDSWHGRLKNYCPSFSLVSITPVSGCEEGGGGGGGGGAGVRNSLKTFCPASSQWLTGLRHADAPVSRAAGERGGGMTGRLDGNGMHINTFTRLSEANQIHTRL